MQHYQVPSAEYSSYINQVISLGLAEDYIAQLRASCSPNSPPSLRAAIDQACRHLSGLVDDLQPVPASAPGVHSLETLSQQNGAPVSGAAVGLAAALPNTPGEEARIPQLTQLINARHGAATPQSTVQAEHSAAKLWRRCCEQEAHRFPNGDLMSQAKIFGFSMWLVDEAVQQKGARNSLSSIGDYLCHLKERAALRRPHHPRRSRTPGIQAVRDLIRARGKEMQAENLTAQVAAQVEAALSAKQLRQSLQAAFQQQQWQWTYLLRMAMMFMPATLGRSDDLRKLPWSCLALRTQDVVGPVPSVAILFSTETIASVLLHPRLRKSNCHATAATQGNATRYCEQEASPDGDLMSHAKILEFSIWLVDEAVQQNGARYSFSSVGDYLCHLKEVRREQYSHGHITSDVPAPLEIQAVRDLACARGKDMQAENLNAQVAAQKQWQWAYLLRMAMTFMPATLGRSDDLRKLPWSCLALRTQAVGPVPSVAILFGSMQGKTVKPGQVDIPGVVRYRDHRICPQALANLAVATFHRGTKLEDLAKFIVAAPSMQGNQPMSGETLNIHLRQAFELAGVPCDRLDGYSAKGEASHEFKKHGVKAAQSMGINKAEIKMAARKATQAMLCILNSIVPQLTSVLPRRQESDTTDLYCIFDPGHSPQAGCWGREWHENHRLGQAEFKAEEDVLDHINPRLDSAPAPSWHAMPPCLSFAGTFKSHRPPAASNASFGMQSYGDQWLRTIPPTANRLLQSAVGKQLRQETWDKHVAAEAVLSDRNLLFTNPKVCFFKTLGGKEATPLAPVVMLPQVPLSDVQPPASAKPIPWVPLASQASYGITLPPQSLSVLSASDLRQLVFIGDDVVDNNLKPPAAACLDFILAGFPME
eukprot:jgi/Astpho2/4459/Aster-00068